MRPLQEMSPREIETVLRNIGKANPPPILHRYRRPCNWAIKELSVPEVHVARAEDMNDPFEYRAPISIEEGKLKAGFYRYARQELGLDHDAAMREVSGMGENSAGLMTQNYEKQLERSGMVCCSRNPLSNRLWAYYGDGHKGICIGYSTANPPFSFARQVSYSDPMAALDLMSVLESDPSLLSDNVTCRKGLEWQFEEEFRIPLGGFDDTDSRLLPIPPEAIVEIRLGFRIGAEFRARVIDAAKQLPRLPRLLQIGCDYKTFSLTETEIQPS